MFGQGISREGDVLDLAVNAGIVNKSGAWYAYEGDKIGQGRENAKTYIHENPAFFDMLEAKVRDFYLHSLRMKMLQYRKTLKSQRQMSNK